VSRQRTARLPRSLGQNARQRSLRVARSSAQAQRRLLGLALLLISLVLATVYLREAEEGALHEAQRAGVAVLDPLTVAGERIARPFRDAYSYVDGLADAEAENEVLRAEIAQLRRDVLRNQTAVEDVVRLERALDYVRGATFPGSYESVVARVVQVPSSPFRQEIVIAAGSSDGVERDAPVVSLDGGLVGRVTEVASSSAKVGLLSDPRIVVSAMSVPQAGAAPANGVVEAGSSPAAGLVFERVSKAFDVKAGEPVVTAGWRVAGLESLFPPDIPIGTVRSASRQDIDLYQRIQIVPTVDFENLQEVIVLREIR
jgi:rod shape-determining protein MreC